MITPLLNAIAPLIVLMALGGVLKRTLVRDDTIWAGLESIVYYVLMPALLFSKIAGANLSGLPWAHLLLTLYLPIIIMSMVALAPMLWRDSLSRATRGSLLQGITRFNLYISLGVGVSLFDSQTMAVLALLSAAIVVLVNLICVGALVTLNSGHFNPKATLIELTKNPLILACLAGALASALSLQLPEFINLSIERLGQTALPLSLLAIGAGLNLGRFGANMPLNLYSSMMQLIAKPLIAASLVWVVGLDLTYGLIIVLLLATPTAPSSYILARKLGGDAESMASIIVFQTTVGLGTLLIMLSLWQVITGISLA